MADPATLAIMAATAQVAKAGMDGLQGYQQGKAEARVASQNAEVARRNAKQARAESDLAEEAIRRQMRKELGQAFTSYAQSGGGVDAGVMAQQASEGELAALNQRYEGETRRLAGMSQAAGFDFEARMAKRRAKGAAAGGVLGTAAAALSGYANVQNVRSEQRRQREASKLPSSYPGGGG